MGSYDMLSLDGMHVSTLLCLTTSFFLSIYSLSPFSLSLRPSSVLAIIIHGDTPIFVCGGVTKASGSPPRQMALRGWLETCNGHLEKLLLRVKTGSLKVMCCAQLLNVFYLMGIF